MGLRKLKGRGVAAPPFSGRAAVNLGGPSYYGSVWPTINLIRTAQASGWTPATWTNSNGWLTSVPNGSSTELLVLFDVQDAPYGYVKTGNYVITWTGALAVAPSGSNPHVSSVSSSAGRCTFTLSAIGDVQPYLFITVSNSSGSAASVNDICVMSADHEALHDAGEIFNPDFLADISANVSTLRFMDWGKTNNSDVVDVADMTTESMMVWFDGAGVPPSIIGKLGAKTGKNIWACVPHQATDTAMEYYFDQIEANYPSGNIHAEYSNECWNFIFEQTIWCRDVGSVGLVIVDANGNPSSSDQNKIACAYADGSLRAWAAAEAAFGSGRVVRVYCAQAIFSAMAAGTEYVDPGHISTGEPVKDLMAQYAIAPYLYPSNSSGDTLEQTEDFIKPKAYDENDAWWDQRIAYGITAAATRASDSKAAIEAKNPAILFTSYEGGHHMGYQMGFTTVENCTINTGTNTIYFGGVDISTWFDNGDVLWTYPNGSTFMAPSLGFNVPIWVRKLGTTDLRAYASEAAYTADSGNTGSGAISLSANPALTYAIDWYTRIVALGERVKGLLSASNGLAWYQDYYADVFVANDMLLMNHYTDVGLWANGRETFQWGMKPYYGATDTPRSTWFKTI